LSETDPAALPRVPLPPLADPLDTLWELDLEPEPDSAGTVYRFVRALRRAGRRVLAPDHTPPRRRLRTVGGDTGYAVWQLLLADIG